jgi:hypothetical protein
MMTKIESYNLHPLERSLGSKRRIVFLISCFSSRMLMYFFNSDVLSWASRRCGWRMFTLKSMNSPRAPSAVKPKTTRRMAIKLRTYKAQSERHLIWTHPPLPTPPIMSNTAQGRSLLSLVASKFSRCITSTIILSCEMPGGPPASLNGLSIGHSSRKGTYRDTGGISLLPDLCGDDL